MIFSIGVSNAPSQNFLWEATAGRVALSVRCEGHIETSTFQENNCWLVTCGLDTSHEKHAGLLDHRNLQQLQHRFGHLK